MTSCLSVLPSFCKSVSHTGILSRITKYKKKFLDTCLEWKICIFGPLKSMRKGTAELSYIRFFIRWGRAHLWILKFALVFLPLPNVGPKQLCVLIYLDVHAKHLFLTQYLPTKSNQTSFDSSSNPTARPSKTAWKDSAKTVKKSLRELFIDVFSSSRHVASELVGKSFIFEKMVNCSLPHSSLEICCTLPFWKKLFHYIQRPLLKHKWLEFLRVNKSYCKQESPFELNNIAITSLFLGSINFAWKEYVFIACAYLCLHFQI